MAKMFLSLRSILLLVFATRAYALYLLPQTLPIHAPNATEKSMQRNETSEEFLNLTNRNIVCMKVHGENMPINSCNAALAKIPRSTEPKLYVTRASAHRSLSSDQVSTPIRYLSDDGECAIDVILAEVSAVIAPRVDHRSCRLTFSQGSSGDEASSDVIYRNAKIVMDTCVIAMGKGGVKVDFSTYFGIDDHLRVHPMSRLSEKVV